MSCLRIAVAIAALTVCAACAPKADLENAQAELNQLRTDTGRLSAENATLRKDNEQLKTELAKRSAIPLKVAFRKAVMGPGLVAVIETTVKSPIAAVAVVKSVSLGTSKNVELHIDPTRVTELGHAEGVTFLAGDTMTFENKEYTSLTFTVPTM